VLEKNVNEISIKKFVIIKNCWSFLLYEFRNVNIIEPEMVAQRETKHDFYILGI
jgi:hypothetical protein